MKKTIYTAIITVFVAMQMQAQDFRCSLRNATPEQRREVIRQMSPEQRRELLKQVRENMMMEDLKIEDKNKDQFKKVYSEYQDAQSEIKGKFTTDFDPDQLSDAEARQKLEESFQMGEQLLDNRRKYSQKMQSIMKPQQVLKMFRTEGMIRERTLERHGEMRDSIPRGRFLEGNRGNGQQPGFTPPGRRK